MCEEITQYPGTRLCSGAQGEKQLFQWDDGAKSESRVQPDLAEEGQEGQGMLQGPRDGSWKAHFGGTGTKAGSVIYLLKN